MTVHAPTARRPTLAIRRFEPCLVPGRSVFGPLIPHGSLRVLNRGLHGWSVRWWSMCFGVQRGTVAAPALRHNRW